MFKSIKYLLNTTLFALCVQFTFAAAPDWGVNAADYQYTATISGAVVFDEGTQLGDAGDEFAAFDGNGNV